MPTPVLEALEGLRSRRAEQPIHHEVSCTCEQCAMARTVALDNLGHLIGLNDLDEGLYGPRGWTVLSGVAVLALQYSDWMWMDTAEDFPGVKPEEMIDYLPYFGGDSWLAKRIWGRIPEAALEERQNYAPSLGAILDFIKDHPDDALFSGYLIGPQRFDERLSADALYISPEFLGLDSENADALDAYDAFIKLGLDQVSSPDEICQWYRERPYWRFWWD